MAVGVFITERLQGMQAVRLDVPVPGTGENGLSEQCVAITAAQGALRSFSLRDNIRAQ